MRKLVVIDLSSADVELFEAYERKVLPLLGKCGATLEYCVRSADGNTETHLLCFPDVKCFKSFLDDPIRIALKGELENSGAVSTISDVEQVVYG